MSREPPGAGEVGGAAVEVALVAPLLIVMLLFVVGLGRLASARAAVDGAARDAAREASIRRGPGRAVAEAEALARDSLAGRDVTCQELAVDVDVAELRPGGSVAVEVACTVALADVTLSGLPGSKRLRASFVAPVDRLRGDNPGDVR